jgi:hypothetical protein
MNKTQNNIEISNEIFSSIVKEKILNCKSKEKVLGGSIDIGDILYDSYIARLPFIIIFEDEKEIKKYYKCFDSNGLEINIELLGYVNEIKNGKSISRNYIKDKVERN